MAGVIVASVRYAVFSVGISRHKNDKIPVFRLILEQTVRYVAIKNGQGMALVGVTGGGSSPVQAVLVGNTHVPIEYIAFSARRGSTA